MSGNYEKPIDSIQQEYIHLHTKIHDICSEHTTSHRDAIPRITYVDVIK